MKKSIAAGVMVAVLGLSALAYSRFATPTDPACADLAKNKRLDVNALVDFPHCASGAVEVQGKVNSLFPEQHSLMLIDLSEEDNCDDGCPIKRLPVAWKGKMPSKGELVLASGSVKKEGTKFLFSAETIAPLPKQVTQ